MAYNHTRKRPPPTETMHGPRMTLSNRSRPMIAAGGLGAAGLMLLGVATAGMAQAHGYVSGPHSRAQACKLGLNKYCDSIVYEPYGPESDVALRSLDSRADPHVGTHGDRTRTQREDRAAAAQQSRCAI